MNLHDVLVVERLQDFCLNEDRVNVTGRTDILGFDDFDRVALAVLNVMSQEDVPEPSFSQLLAHVILLKAGGRVELFASGGIENSSVFKVLEIIFEILCAVSVEESYD